MCDFTDRLIARVANLPGVEWIKLEDGGVDGIRRHALLVGQVSGKPFRFPLPRCPKDKPRRWLNYYCQLRRLIRRLADVQPIAKTASTMARIKKRKPRKAGARRWVPSQPPSREPTRRLDQNPFEALATLATRLASA